MYTGDRIDIRYTLLISEMASRSFVVILIFNANARNATACDFAIHSSHIRWRIDRRCADALTVS